jgi:hypothetical protein
MSNAAIISSRVKNSRPSGMLQPMVARKLSSASGTMPCFRYDATEVSSLRLLTLLLSGLRNSGMCTNRGRSQPKAR